MRSDENDNKEIGRGLRGLGNDASSAIRLTKEEEQKMQEQPQQKAWAIFQQNQAVVGSDRIIVKIDNFLQVQKN